MEQPMLEITANISIGNNTETWLSYIASLAEGNKFKPYIRHRGLTDASKEIIGKELIMIGKELIRQSNVLKAE